MCWIPIKEVVLMWNSYLRILSQFGHHGHDASAWAITWSIYCQRLDNVDCAYLPTLPAKPPSKGDITIIAKYSVPIVPIDHFLFSRALHSRCRAICCCCFARAISLLLLLPWLWSEAASKPLCMQFSRYAAFALLCHFAAAALFMVRGASLMKWWKWALGTE